MNRRGTDVAKKEERKTGPTRTPGFRPPGDSRRRREMGFFRGSLRRSPLGVLQDPKLARSLSLGSHILYMSYTIV